MLKKNQVLTFKQATQLATGPFAFRILDSTGDPNVYHSAGSDWCLRSWSFLDGNSTIIIDNPRLPAWQPILDRSATLRELLQRAERRLYEGDPELERLLCR